MLSKEKLDKLHELIQIDDTAIIDGRGFKPQPAPPAEVGKRVKIVGPPHGKIEKILGNELQIGDVAIIWHVNDTGYCKMEEDGLWYPPSSFEQQPAGGKEALPWVKNPIDPERPSTVPEEYRDRMQELAYRLHPPERDDMRAGVLQMLTDLLALAHNDGCIAAGWAFEQLTASSPGTGDGWRAINDMPAEVKDGRAIWAWCGPEIWDEGGLCMPRCTREGKWITDARCPTEVFPTHWQPVVYPEPPAPIGGREKA